MTEIENLICQVFPREIAHRPRDQLRRLEKDAVAPVLAVHWHAFYGDYADQFRTASSRSRALEQLSLRAGRMPVIARSAATQQSGQSGGQTIRGRLSPEMPRRFAARNDGAVCMSKQSVLLLGMAPSFPGGRLSSSIAGAVRTGSRVSLSACNAVRHDGTTAGLGDPAAQAHAALDGIETALQAAGGSLADITRLSTCLVDRAHRKSVYDAIGQRLRDVYPVSTGLIVAGLPLPELVVQIDAEAVIGAEVTRHRTFALNQWFGQDIAWQGAMVAATDSELFIRGQTGSSFDGRTMAGTGRRAEDAAAQADLALTNLATLLRECGSDLDEICRITVYISDRGYRSAVYPVIGQHLAGVRPVSTGLIVNGFARPEILFELDVQVIRKNGGPHLRIRPYHSNLAHYGLARQDLGCEFCMAVRAGEHIRLRGQTGVDLNEHMHGIGDAVAQAEQAMENVATLLGEAGASMADVTKAMVFVTDRAFLTLVAERVLRRLAPATPAFSAVIVKGLASPELLMEVDISAVIPGGVA